MLYGINAGRDEADKVFAELLFADGTLAMLPMTTEQAKQLRAQLQGSEANRRAVRELDEAIRQTSEHGGVLGHAEHYEAGSSKHYAVAVRVADTREDDEPYRVEVASGTRTAALRGAEVAELIAERESAAARKQGFFWREERQVRKEIALLKEAQEIATIKNKTL